MVTDFAARNVLRKTLRRADKQVDFAAVDEDWWKLLARLGIKILHTNNCEENKTLTKATKKSVPSGVPWLS